MGSLISTVEAVRTVVEEAVWAPSVHNTQPWWFGAGERSGRPTVTLHADVDRRLAVADPAGREMLVSCGAALYTLRLAVAAAGYEPEVRMENDPDRPGLLADVSFGPPREPGRETLRAYAEIRRRRSHRGGFDGGAPPCPLPPALSLETRYEGATLDVVSGPALVALGALTEAAEQVLRMDPAYVREMARWAPAPDSGRGDGVHQSSYPREPRRTEPHFATRDFARGHGWGADAGPTGSVGTVCLLTTPGDERPDWLAAGQALQRMLLRASAEGVSAALHTQATEVPEIRNFIRTRFCQGTHPQVLLRLGRTRNHWSSVRRPAAAVLREH